MSRIIDPELKYCPNCDDEYRAEITSCADCDVVLISGQKILDVECDKNLKKSSRNMVLNPDDEMVSIRKGSVIEMKEFQIMLKRRGIPSLAVTEDGSCGQGCCGANILVQIRRSDAEEVMALLDQEHVRSTGLEGYDMSTAGSVFNTDAEHAVCPACGHNFSTAESVCPDCGLCFS